MASRLTALPLGAGEAFLLQTRHAERDWAILVDSGNLETGTPHPLVAAITKVSPKLQRIDVAICTHQDRDHARGFRTFFDHWCSSGRTIGGIWLPGRWSAAIPKALFDPVGLINEIWHGAREAAKIIGNDELKEAQISLDERLHRLARRGRTSQDIEQYPREIGQTGRRGGDEQSDPIEAIESENRRADFLAASLGVAVEKINVLDNLIDESGNSPSSVIARLEDSLRQDVLKWPYADSGFFRTGVLFAEAIETATTITTIAESAVRWRIPIRWFDFGKFEELKQASGGIARFLEPVNAIELRRPPQSPTALELLYSLRLTRQNVESLVFLRLESNDEPAVMFAGDSRLSFGIDQPEEDFPKPAIPMRRMIVTAPHHGSRVNDEAYRIIGDWLDSRSWSPIYVRNGGHHKMKICAFLKQASRCCARCRLCSPNKLLTRTVTLDSHGNDWDWPAKIPKCKGK